MGAWVRRSDDRGVTPSQETVHVFSLEVMPLGSKGTLGTWSFQLVRGWSDTEPTKSHVRTVELGYGQTTCSRGVCDSALKPHCAWKGPWKKYGQDFQPDLGNPAIRHDRGASKKVATARSCSPKGSRRMLRRQSGVCSRNRS